MCVCVCVLDWVPVLSEWLSIHHCLLQGTCAPSFLQNIYHLLANDVLWLIFYLLITSCYSVLNESLLVQVYNQPFTDTLIFIHGDDDMSCFLQDLWNFIPAEYSMVNC